MIRATSGYLPRMLSVVVLAACALAPAVSRAATAPVAGVKVPLHERIRLPNGLTVIVVPKPEVPLIAFGAVLRGGGTADPADKPGVASLVASLLDKGAGKRTAFEFADAVAGAGGSFSAAAGAESITVGGQFLSRDRQLMVDLLADALLRPTLDATEFDKLRGREIELIKAAKDSDPSGLTGAYGRAFLFGAHPYGRPVSGSERSLAAIGHADVVEFRRAHFGADRTTLIFAGDIDAAWIKRAVAASFGKWSAAPTKLAPLAAASPQRGQRVLLVDSPGSVQAYFWIGSIGVDRLYGPRAELDIVNTLYGGRFTSILNTELRIKSGLSYGANSSFTRGSVPGEFAIRSFVLTENTGKALEMAYATLRDLKRGEVAPAMLESARSYVLGQYPTRLETAAHWAAALGDLELFNLTPSYIEEYGPKLRAVDASGAKAVIADAFPAPEDTVIVVIGDAAKIRDELKKYGPVTEMALTATDFAPR
jgi:predicted Zn-dependent peptidase